MAAVTRLAGADFGGWIDGADYDDFDGCGDCADFDDSSIFAKFNAFSAKSL